MTAPNVLYLHSHDTGRFVQPYGFAAPTPRIQKLAEEGMLFRQAFCTAPTCSASRSGLLTGQAPHTCGQLGLVNRGFELRDREKHLANVLHNAGYHTVLAGMHHEVRDPATVGYQQILGPDRRGDDANALAAAEYLAGRPREPFFLSVGFFSTHRPFPEPGASDRPDYCRPPAPLPDTPETRYDTACFNASARKLDECFSKVLGALDQSGLAERTLVICTTDHGIAFPFMKCNLTDHGTGVMLILRGPGGFSGGKVTDALVSHVDIYPTVCELAEIPLPEWLQGRSLLPLARGEAEEVNDAVFAGVTYHAAYEPMRCVRTRRWKYIRRFAECPRVMLANIDDSPSKKLFVSHGLAEREVRQEELYDLAFDPNESCNRAGDPELGPTLCELRSRLEEWMRRTGDPLLAGPVPLPEGAYVSAPSDASPGELWSRHKRPPGCA